MKRLIFTEILKLIPFRTTWIILGLFFLLVPLIFYILPNLIPSDAPFDPYRIYGYSKIWLFLPYLASFFNILLGILIIISVTNDFSFKILRQNVIDGFTRKDWLLSKYMSVLGLALIATLFIFIAGLAFASAYSGSFDLFSENFNHLGLYFFQCLGYFSFAVLVAILFKRSGLGIVLFILYIFFIEPPFRFFLPPEIGNYLPMSTISNMLPFPVESAQMESNQSTSMKFASNSLFDVRFFVGLGYTVLFGLISYYILKKQDL